MPITLEEQVAVEEVGPGEYVSKALPGRMGNMLPIAYGGCTLAIAINTAYATVPPSHRLYSATGHFLGPASTKEKYHCTVHNTRDTKTFATRRVVMSQTQQDGKNRVCMELLADFHVEEPALLTYSTPPSRTYSGPDQSSSTRSLSQAAVAEGKMGEAQSEAFARTFALSEGYFDTRLCPEGVTNQNLLGYLKAEPTTQDHLPITSKSSAEWTRTWQRLLTPGERAAAVAFVMDGAISFLPLSLNHMWLDDSGACSSLDFALRFFAPDVDVDRWHLKEMKTIAAGYGRSYTEARLWDADGNMVASMTQQGILRPTKVKPQM